MIKNQLFIAAALLAGVAIGYLLKPEEPVEAVGEAGYVAAAKIDDRGETASVKALRARIAELEELLRAKDAEVQAKPQGEVAGKAEEKDGRGARRGPPSMKEMRERMEKLKKEDPKKFAEITERMEKWRQRRVERANAKLEFLSSIDTDGMTDEQKQQHEKYQNLIARREELEEKMHNAEISDEDREDIMREMRETDRALHQAARGERETLIGQTAKALGFVGEDATAVSATIRDVISSTEQGHGFNPPPPGGAGPAGPR